MFHSPSLPVWRILCVNSVSMDWTWMSNMNLVWDLTIVILRHPCLLRMAKAVSLTIELLNSVTSHSVNSVHIVMWALATKCVPIELVPYSDRWWKLDDKWQIWCQGFRSPQFCRANKIATKEHVLNYSNQWDVLSPHLLKPTSHQWWFAK